MENSIIIMTASSILLALIFLSFILTQKKGIKIGEDAVPLEKVLPVQNIENGFIINGNGDITAGYKIFFPEVFTLTPAETEKFFSDWDGILKMLPPGTVIHQQNFYYTDTYANENLYSTQNFMEQENLGYYAGKPILKNYSNIYITFTNHTSSARNSTSSLLRKPNYPFRRPYKNYHRQLEEAATVLSNFENSLKSIPQSGIIRMNDEELNNAIYDFINQSYEHPVRDAKQQTVSPISVSSEGDLKIGNKFIAVLSLTEEGSTLYPYGREPKTVPSESFATGINIPENIKSRASMIYPLGLGLPVNHILNVVIEITDQDTTLSKLKSSNSNLNFLALFYEPAQNKKQQIKTFCNEISMNGYNTACAGISIILKDTDRQQLQRNISLAANAFMNMNHSKCYVENFETANLFFSSIPGNARSNYRGFTTTTKHALCYLNKEGLYISDKNGFLYLDRFHNPVTVDFCSRNLMNKNILCIGPSGSGKSYSLNYFIFQCVIHSFDVIIIDIGGSYKSMVHLNGGRYFDSSERELFAFNPFLCPKDGSGKYTYLIKDADDDEAGEDNINFIATVIAFIWKGEEKLRPIEWALLKDSVIQFYEYANTDDIFPCMREYRNFILSDKFKQNANKKIDTEEMAILLKPYATGELSYLLNSEQNINIIDDTLIAFDLEAVKKEKYFPIVSIIILHLTAEKIRQKKGVNKRLIIDEGLDFLLDEKMGDFIGYLFRTFRKKEGGILLAAQNVAFLRNIPDNIRDSILINCDTKMILDHRNYASSYPALKEILSFTDDEINMLDSVLDGTGWRQFFLKMGKRSFILTLDVCPVVDTAFKSEQSVVQEILSLFYQTRSLPAALNQYIENKKKKKTQDDNSIKS